jgi:hypothetical protein
MRSFRFPLATTAFVIAMVVVGAGFIWNINIIELPLDFFARIEKSEIDEIITLMLLIGAGVLGDRAIEARRTLARMEAERLHAIQVTMGMVRNIVDEFLAQLNLLRAEVRTNPKKYARVEAHMFEQSVAELSSRLNAVEGFR